MAYERNRSSTTATVSPPLTDTETGGAGAASPPPSTPPSSCVCCWPPPSPQPASKTHASPIASLMSSASALDFSKRRAATSERLLSLLFDDLRGAHRTE